MRTIKIKIHPNNKQSTKIKQTMNKCIEAQNIVFDLCKQYLDNNLKLPSCSEIRKEFTKIKKIKDDEVLEKRKGLTKKEQRSKHLDVLFYDVSNDSLKQMIKDTYNAFIRYFKKLGKYPNRKSFKDKHKSIYVDPYKIKFTSNKVKLEKISPSLKENRQVLNWVNLAEKDRIPLNVKYYNPRVIFDGYNFYLTIGLDDKDYPFKEKEEKEQSSPLGLDLNISNFVTSNNDVYKNINSSKKVKKLSRRLKRYQRRISRKIEHSKQNKIKLSTCKNFIKQKKQIYNVYSKLRNIRENSYYQISHLILSKNPKYIVIEDLDVKSMYKNKRIASLLQITGFRKFVNILENISSKYNIQIKKVDRYYPSSKMCSSCSHIKEKLSLSTRTYICSSCGLSINRDLNASINLLNYKF